MRKLKPERFSDLADITQILIVELRMFPVGTHNDLALLLEWKCKICYEVKLNREIEDRRNQSEGYIRD